MRRWIKRLLVLLIIGGVCGAAYRIVKNRNQHSKTAIPAREPAWPPFEPSPFEPSPFEPSPFEPSPFEPSPFEPSAFEPAPTIEPARTTDAEIEPAPQAEPEAAARRTASEAPDWLPPVDGECPAGYPIKANDNSHIYHMPGGRFYGRPIAERCYATEAAAQRDGYRRAKS